ncbi:MAG: TonB-dependent receptor [Caulobacteraceae bacterium]|nr:TonB-dependent receptor [Caulobacteraceae bacterium]
MMNRKRVFWATSALFTGMIIAGAANAQSTGTEATEVEQVVITGTRGPRTIDGAIVAEDAGKSRNTITQEFIGKQAAGQTILQTLNLTPGLNFTNNDPYGSSGGNIRLHGFDGNRVSLTFDGIPLNDTGNYATYSNQQLDPELIERASVNTGTTDVDSPTASATGGTINYTVRRPASDFGGWVQGTLGDFGMRRIMGLVDTGEVGPWGTSAWFAVSKQEYDKFKGLGELKKTQYNFRIYQPVGDNGDFISLSAHYNVNRNNNYLGPNLRTATGFCDVAKTQVCVDQVNDPTNAFGWNVDLTPTYTAPTFRNGTADVDSNGTAFYGLRINPSNTGNIRGQSKFTLGHGLTFTFDPSFQYTLADGGTQNTTISERDALIRGTIGAATPTAGVDINKDGDTLDTVRVMNPSVTNTHRYGVNTSLIWDINDDHRIRGAYTLDWGRHRQTGIYGLIDFSDPTNPRYNNPFGGRDSDTNIITNLDGYQLRARDRKSIAELNQFAAEYRGFFFDHALRINLGVRAPFFKRELNQYCYSQNASSNVLCTTQTPNAALANGNVTFGTSTTQYIRPYSAEKKYDDILPNVSANYKFGEGHSVYASYAENLSAPRTDSLYTVLRLADGSVGNPNVQPEHSANYDIGYRYSSPTVVASIAGYLNKYQDRIVNTYDEDLGYFVDRNVGDVDIKGVDASIGWSPTEALSIYASASFTDSELLNDYRLTATTVAATKGKELVETPDQMYSLRLDYKFNEVFSAGIQGKYVGERWLSDVNDLKDDAYATADIDARFDFSSLGFEGTYLQLNIINVTDEDYYGSLGTVTSATPGQPGYGRPFAQVGAPRTMMASLRVAF